MASDGERFFSLYFSRKSTTRPPYRGFSRPNVRFSLTASPDGDSDLSQKLAAALDAAGVPVNEGQADDESTDIDVEAPVVPSEGRFLCCWSLCVVKDKRTGMVWRGLARQRFESIQIELFCVCVERGGCVCVCVTLVCRSRMWT